MSKTVVKEAILRIWIMLEAVTAQLSVIRKDVDRLCDGLGLEIKWDDNNWEVKEKGE